MPSHSIEDILKEEEKARRDKETLRRICNIADSGLYYGRDASDFERSLKNIQDELNNKKKDG